MTVDGAGYVALAKRDNMQNPTIGGQFARLSMPSISSIGPYRQWCQRADAVGFPVGGMTMALVVRGEMLDVYSTTFVRGRPKHCVGSIELTSIAQMTATHGVTKTFVVILFNDGGVVEFEALSRSKAKRFVAALLAQRDAR